MFLGTYKTYFTGKNRILLPKKFRKELGNEDKFYIVRGLDGEIWGFSNTEWQKEAEIRLNIPLTDAKGRDQRRKFFSQAEECVLDNQGRFIISKELSGYAELDKEVLLVGAGDHIEIWNPKQWTQLTKRGI